MVGMRFFELPEGLLNTQMEKGPEEFREFTENEMGLLKRSIGRNSVVLDVGCGYGKYIAELCGKAKQVFGIDSSKPMIEKAMQELGKEKNVKLFLGDAEKMPFENDFFDFVICTRNTFGNFLNQQNVLGEMRRVLKPGGKMFIGVYSQKAKKLQLGYYKKNKMRITRETEDCVFALPDFKSERFSKEKLRRIFRAQKLKAEIIPLNRIAFECTVTKN